MGYINAYYYNCHQYYTNKVNACQVSFVYTNYADSQHPDLINNISLTWEDSSLKQDTGVSSVENLLEYAAALNELKDKINILVNQKGRNTVPENETSVTKDSTKVLSTQYNSLLSTLDNLYTQLKNSGTDLSSSTEDNLSLRTQVSGLQNKIQELAQDTTIYYLNYLETDSPCVEGTTPPQYIDKVTYNNSSSSQSNNTTKTGTAYARYLDYNVNTCTETGNLKYS